MNTSSENIYKCLFYGILFIFLIIIILLLLNKKKEKYDANITIPQTSSSNIIQVDQTTGDLSEIDTNSILTALNSIIDQYINHNTIFDTITVNTTAYLNGATNITGNINLSATSTISNGNISNTNLTNTTLTNTTLDGTITCTTDLNIITPNTNKILQSDSNTNTLLTNFTLVINDLSQNFGQNYGNLPNMATTNNNTDQGKNVVMSMGTYYGSNIDQFSWSYFGGNTLVTENKNGIPTPLAYSIICGNRVLASSFDAYSDERIKNNITDIDTKKSLDIIRQIQPKRYTYKDIIKKGDKPEWGFIAQQVKSLLENSTNLVSEFIPDIYELAQVSYSNIIKLDIKTTINFEINEKIRLVKNDGKYLDTKISGVLDNYTFTIEENINQEKIFVYGREVHDLHTLNKDCIFTIATSALKEVDKELQNEKVLRQQLENRIEIQHGDIKKLYNIIQTQNKIIEKQGNDIKEIYSLLYLKK